MNADEPQPAVAIPVPPAAVTGEALEEWKRRSRQLVTLGILSELDWPSFVAYCKAWGRYVAAEAQVDATGEVLKSPSGYPIPNPYRAVANKALQQCQQFWSEFGMMPSSRTRVNASRPKGAAPPQSKVERFMRRAK